MVGRFGIVDVGYLKDIIDYQYWDGSMHSLSYGGVVRNNPLITGMDGIHGDSCCGIRFYSPMRRECLRQRIERWKPWCHELLYVLLAMRMRGLRRRQQESNIPTLLRDVGIYESISSWWMVKYLERFIISLLNVTKVPNLSFSSSFFR